MRKIRIDVEYDGTGYAGWQRQENALAVQQVLEKALSKLTREDIHITGASRTDAGVHAMGLCAHFDSATRIPPEKIAFALNTMLPPDIRIRESGLAKEGFHVYGASRRSSGRGYSGHGCPARAAPPGVRRSE